MEIGTDSEVYHFALGHKNKFKKVVENIMMSFTRLLRIILMNSAKSAMMLKSQTHHISVIVEFTNITLESENFAKSVVTMARGCWYSVPNSRFSMVRK